MLFVLVFFAVSLLETMMCYTYRTKPLFLSFSELAALEENSLKRTHSPSADQRLKKTFVLKCHEDSIEVTMKARLFHPALPVEPEHFRLGPVGASVQRHCTAKVSGNGDYIIRAPLTDCGSEVMLTQSALLYRNLLLYWPPSSPGDWQKRGAAVSVHCEYRRRYTVSSRAPKPTWSPLISIQSELLDLDFQLRLMTDDWSGGRRSPVYFLGETVNIEASVDHPHHPLRLFVNGCAAALSSEMFYRLTAAQLKLPFPAQSPRRSPPNSTPNVPLPPGPQTHYLYNLSSGSRAHFKQRSNKEGVFFY
ncbi:zona pellucida sperm-binding protein 3-like isoform X2 [Labrus mixtus]|uniref:zona pellucida sperm-binding protein 3-like isoform X2 n=1 Tax=Labrus mixtus TaxID=508554 RepID=UPI0029C0857A|nr:zona pellucida sperm-binding protein 3-like isoform X2 [Labrus mixtus]